MQNGLLLLILAVSIASFALPQANKSKTTARSHSASKHGKSTKKKSTSTAGTWKRQTAPTPDRYREIQQALIAKGYLKSEATGVWDAQSSDALLQFQTDHNLSPTGKISSASLIGLGLGSKTSAPPPALAAGTPSATEPLP
jgi:peptidoglycan hydrolase-like protein with peptidoglycan-binding domain